MYSTSLSVRNLRGVSDSATNSLSFSRASDFLLINFTTEYMLINVNYVNITRSIVFMSTVIASNLQIVSFRPTKNHENILRSHSIYIQRIILKENQYKMT